MLLLLLLSRFSHVRLCATPKTAAHQAPLSLGFSRQEHWSGLPFPSPMHESESEVAQSCPTLSDPIDCSPPGSSIHGIFQARVLECYRAVIPASSCPLLHKGASLMRPGRPQIRHRPDRRKEVSLRKMTHQKLSFCYLQTLAFITYGSENECKIFLSNLNTKPY